MRKLRALVGVALMSACCASAAGEFHAAADSRGMLLYTTYCVGCHTAEIHWREKKLVSDWTSLKAQVRRWQGNSGLALSEDDIAAISQHLNDLHYHFVSPDAKQVGEAHRPKVRRPG